MLNRWGISMLGIGIACLGLLLLGVDASARIQLGGGMASLGESFVPFGRVAIDVLPLGFATVAVDAEYWFITGSSQWLFPFATFSFPLILQPSLGVAPIVSISSVGIRLGTIAFALKGGIGLSLGPLGLFAEAILNISPQFGFSKATLFTLGLALSF